MSENNKKQTDNSVEVTSFFEGLDRKRKGIEEGEYLAQPEANCCSCWCALCSGGNDSSNGNGAEYLQRERHYWLAMLDTSFAFPQ